MPYRHVGRSTPGRGNHRYESLLFGRIVPGVSRDSKEASVAGVEKTRDRLAGAQVIEVSDRQSDHAGL